MPFVNIELTRERGLRRLLPSRPVLDSSLPALRFS